jgi:5-(carboxyamino)imidazole ribonucleotide synthase
MRIGIIGAGQLGQMLGDAANRIGHRCRFLDPAENPPAARAGATIRAAYDDEAALRELASGSDVITYEFENVPVESLRPLADRLPIYPPPDALRLAQDRLSEKRLFEGLDIPLPAHRAVDTLDDLVVAGDQLGYPLVLKTRRFGYDGKGQVVLQDRNDQERAWSELGGQALIAEAWVPFDYEVSIIGARGTDGTTCCWPLTENRHRDGILRVSLAPVNDPELGHVAAAYMQRLLTELDYVGVLALELFVADGKLLANEFAPRVHNSGHWTIEGSGASQFENHVRAVTGMPLGPADCRKFVGMVNLIGEIPAAIHNFDDPRARLHDYGKQARPGRKLGHVTVVTDNAASRDMLVLALQQCLPDGGSL